MQLFIGLYFMNWHQQPEIRLVTRALPLETLWEIIQLPLYDIWREHSWSYILYSVAHCTLGDLLILLVSFELVALFNRNRHWYHASSRFNTLCFTLAGLAYTTYSEIVNTGLAGSWSYTELMPVVPILNVGGAPLLQWIVIPPVLLWLMRRTTIKTNT